MGSLSIFNRTGQFGEVLVHGSNVDPNNIWPLYLSKRNYGANTLPALIASLVMPRLMPEIEEELTRKGIGIGDGLRYPFSIQEALLTCSGNVGTSRLGVHRCLLSNLDHGAPFEAGIAVVPQMGTCIVSKWLNNSFRLFTPCRSGEFGQEVDSTNIASMLSRADLTYPPKGDTIPKRVETGKIMQRILMSEILRSWGNESPLHHQVLFEESAKVGFPVPIEDWALIMQRQDAQRAINEM